ncbi:MAG TPA: DUF4397 domain-containing protein [Chitinophagaceae bacterium]|nr:DUF4397 domain-containing protein [Chitinophagaceae bacterium]
MKKVFLSFRTSIIAASALFAAAVLFTSCMKNKDDNMNIPAAGLMALNLAPDQQSVVVTLNGNLLTQTPLAFGSYNGGYQNIYTGERAIESYDYPSSSPLATTSYKFDEDKYYSVFVVGTSGKYRNVVSFDNFDSLSSISGKAYIRYINAITDSVNAQNVTVAGVTKAAPYASVSQFVEVNPGEVNIAVNGAGVDATRAITVEAKKVYTVLLTGVPGATDATRVQIRFISNGTLTDEGK